jgi:hypothetical protein
MIRHAAAVIVALCLSSSWAAAQGTALTINTASASVHKSPSTASPVIGRAARGATLEVTREVGDWVKVAWPSAPDGVGYVRTNMGSLANATVPASRTAATTPAPRTAIEPSPRPTTAARTDVTQTVGRPPARTPGGYAAPSHVFGIGALIGGQSLGVGASARAWSRGPLGVQFEVSHYSMSNPIDLGEMTSTQFGPSALFSFRDHVSDYTWLRPYVGAGITFTRSSFTSPAVGLAMSDSTTGFQTFGGGELSFSSLPQFSVSAQLGYHWVETPFAGYELNGLGLSVAGHWYVK